jgi:lactoylglutathione lyase
MKIEHIAIWAQDLENLKTFYGRYFGAVASEKYFNSKRNFQSYFLTFNEGCRLELMQMPGIQKAIGQLESKFTGLTHLAISVGSRDAVDYLTETLRNDGFRIVGDPRVTGDGYYESVILDPEGNSIEITV